MNLAKVAMSKRSAVTLFGMLLLADTVAMTQNLPSKEELAAVEQAQLTNQTKLSHYMWQETQLISVNGNAVDYRLYSITIGANGRCQRNLVTEHTGQEATFEPKKKEQLSPYGSYAQQLRKLANLYTSLNSERLSQANSRGDIVLLRTGDSIKLAIKDYTKPGDSVAMTINPRTHHLLRVTAKSYLTDPQDAVTIEAEFDELPDGTDHVATVEIESASNHLTVKLTNWSYQ